MEHEHRTPDAVGADAKVQKPRDTNARSIRPAALDGLIVQAKMSVGPVADPLEREADAVADRVTRVLRSPGVGTGDSAVGAAASKIQRSATMGTAGITVSPVAAATESVQRWPDKATRHFRERAEERGISSEDADAAYAGGQTHVDDGSGARVYWDQSTKVALILSADGKAFVTCYKQRNKKGKWTEV